MGLRWAFDASEECTKSDKLDQRDSVSSGLCNNTY